MRQGLVIPLLLVAVVAVSAGTTLLVTNHATATARSVPPMETLAFVDMRRALEEVTEARQARQRLERELARRQQALDRDQEAFRTFERELETALPMLSEEARMQRLQEYQTRMQELQQRFVNLQRELSELEARATDEVVASIATVASALARERGVTLMIEKNAAGVIYGVAGLDLTDELIARANAR